MPAKGYLGTDGELLESAWQQNIVKAATLAGWSCHHTYDSRKSVGDGFPDLVLVKSEHPVIYAELKRWDGRLSLAQCQWLQTLSQAASTQCYIWVADKMAEGDHHWQEIVRILTHGPTHTLVSQWEWTRLLTRKEASHYVPRAFLRTVLTGTP